MSTEPAEVHASGTEPAHEVVGRDIACVRCGYQLRGLRADGVCPECTGAVARSLHGDLLIFADRRYFLTLHAGSRLAYWSIAGVLASFTLMVIGGCAANAFRKQSLADAAGFAGAALLLLSMLGVPLGWWMLTRPDPDRLSSGDADRARRLAARAAAVVLVAAIMLAPPVVIFLMWPYAMSPRVRMGLQAWSAVPLSLVVIDLSLLLQFWTAARYLERLAPRAQDAWLGVISRWLRYIAAGAAGVLLVSIVLTAAGIHELLALLPVIATIVAFVAYAKATEAAKFAIVRAWTAGATATPGQTPVIAR